MATILGGLIAGKPGLDEELNFMRSKAKVLVARADDVSIEVEYAELHLGKKRRRVVDNWLTSAKNLNKRVKCIEEEVQQCASSNCTRLRGRIVKITKEIEELHEEAEFHNGLTIDDLASSSLPLVTTEFKGALFEKNLRVIRSWLMSDDVSNIGVYGVGGVGKTTLEMHIHNQLRKDFGKHGGVVYWVTVSKECTISQLQHKIAKELKVSNLLEEADEMKRPAIVSEALKRRRNVVLILDDLWDYFPMEKVGLSSSNTQCRLLLTSRSLDVCRRMECQKTVKVEPLSGKESWSLFTERLGNFDDLPCEAKDAAKLVAKECAGLPLGIIVVAASMRGVFDVYEWSNTLEELSKSSRVHEGMENMVFPSLQLSYSRLNNAKLRDCFLSCAMFPEDGYISRDRVVDLWIMEGKLKDIKSWQEQLNMAHTMLNRLINACLLDLLGPYVKMHDLIRDMAINIARPHVMIKSGEELREVPCVQEWTEKLIRVSLWTNEISEITPSMTPRCPDLSILLLGDNPLTVIPDSFFLCLEGIKFLDLSWTSIDEIPPSISCLENLFALNLRGCLKLVYVPSLSKLANLRHLYMGYCAEIDFISQGIETEAKLEHRDSNLRVSFGELTNGLSNLQCLELLNAVNDDIQVRDIEKLETLERLCCQMHDIGNFNRYVKSPHFHRLSSYQFMVGRCLYERFMIRSYSRTIFIRGYQLDGEKQRPLLPRNLQVLEVNYCDFSVSSLVDALPSLNSVASLIRLSIRSCHGIESIWSSEEFPCHPLTKLALEKLEDLKLANLHSFRAMAIRALQLPPSALSSLKTLVVEDCPGMVKLFTPCMMKGQLKNLREIRIDSCEGVEEIFAESSFDDNADVVELPQLRVLTIWNLPKLASICRTALLCGSIEEIAVIGCQRLKKLPFVLQVHGEGSEGIPATSLRKMFVERDWWESLEWDDPRIKHSLRPFVQFSSS